MLQAGEHLGPYEVVAPLGAGGMGEVYRAKDARLDREVAVKVLPEHLAGDPSAMGRFKREAKAVAALSHPNILAIYDVGTEGETSYVVMELLEGETLRDRVRRSTIPWRKASEYGAAIAEGLAAAHAKGIIHRDLKPENIFLTTDGVVKILDFGVARLESPLADGDQGDTTTVMFSTKPGMVVGTLNYMSPERLLGDHGVAQSDIFSFGCILYEMVTGSGPFARETAAETRGAILDENPAEVEETLADIPTGFQRTVMHCLEKNPRQRAQSAHDLAFDLHGILTTSGFTTYHVAPAERQTRGWLWIAVVAAALAVAVFSFWPMQSDDSIDSVAVLPLENLSGDPNQDYFADGMTEALIADLAKISALRVISRTSVMQYKGVHKPLPEIAEELEVDAVVVGTVQRAGDRVRIAAQLIEAATDRHLWAENYERNLHDVLALQSEVARAIAHEIKIKLTSQEQARLASAGQVIPEAHEAYMKARFYWNKRTRAAMTTGLEYFQQAVALDPEYALAYAGIADSYVVLGGWNILKPHDVYPKAKAAATRALEIDDTLAEAHAALAVIRRDYIWDWAGAETAFRKAIQLKPGYATAHQWYAEYLAAMGRHEEATAEIERAQELDPLSLIIHAVGGYVCYFARQYDQAIDHCTRALELDPDFPPAHLYLSWVYRDQGMYKEALAELGRSGLPSEDVDYLLPLCQTYAFSGDRDEALRLVDKLRGLSEQRYIPASNLATVYFALGEKNLAFAYLEQAFEQRAYGLHFLNVSPLYDSVRDDPRFNDLLRRIGLDVLPLQSEQAP
ncbi:MAG: protein kinase domain-containing protein [Planctomycetota bacterium]|jgi:serine/threonine-protein kinase